MAAVPALGHSLCRPADNPPDTDASDAAGTDAGDPEPRLGSSPVTESSIPGRQRGTPGPSAQGLRSAPQQRGQREQGRTAPRPARRRLMSRGP